VTTAMQETRDLQTAGQLQRMLLPPTPYRWRGWNAAHHFQPAGAVSGDYLDLVPHAERLYFMLGDVSGKGVAASLLMAQLHAMFRTLIPFELSLEALMTRASALLCASSLPAQYATLVCGLLDPDGGVAIVNAGHPAPLAIRASGQAAVEATGVPVGLFCKSEFSSTMLTLDSGDTLFLFTDGLTEGKSARGEEYGARVERAAVAAASLRPEEQVSQVIGDNASFRDDMGLTDDLTLLAIQRGRERDDAPDTNI
jgi:sigma-B regulation protein RsbU (phosphoserine phosphatase)